MPPILAKNQRDPKAIDLALVKQVVEGNKTAFNMLVRNHQRGVYAIVFSMVKDHDTTDDIVQDSFIKAYKNIQSFEGKSSFKSWLYSIAINTAKNTLKASSLRNMVDYETVVLHVSPRAGESIEDQEMQAILTEEIEKLPSKQKMALTLRIFDELPFKEIAEIMECPYDTAKANFRHAINSLRKQAKILDSI
ncbi:MAG: sigma-70 family RNA polymerase sigma factor [bacterium]